MTTTIQKWGNSLGVRIPRNIAEDVGFVEGKDVTVEKSGDTLVVRSLKIPRYNLKKLLKGVTAKNKHKEVDWGRPMGKEIW